MHIVNSNKHLKPIFCKLVKNIIDKHQQRNTIITSYDEIHHGQFQYEKKHNLSS